MGWWAWFQRCCAWLHIIFRFFAILKFSSVLTLLAVLAFIQFAMVKLCDRLLYLLNEE